MPTDDNAMTDLPLPTAMIPAVLANKAILHIYANPPSAVGRKGASCHSFIHHPTMRQAASLIIVCHGSRRMGLDAPTPHCSFALWIAPADALCYHLSIDRWPPSDLIVTVHHDLPINFICCEPPSHLTTNGGANTHSAGSPVPASGLPISAKAPIRRPAGPTPDSASSRIASHYHSPSIPKRAAVRAPAISCTTGSPSLPPSVPPFIIPIRPSSSFCS